MHVCRHVLRVLCLGDACRVPDQAFEDEHLGPNNSYLFAGVHIGHWTAFAALRLRRRVCAYAIKVSCCAHVLLKCTSKGKVVRLTRF